MWRIEIMLRFSWHRHSNILMDAHIGLFLMVAVPFLFSLFVKIHVFFRNVQPIDDSLVIIIRFLEEFIALHFRQHHFLLIELTVYRSWGSDLVGLVTSDYADVPNLARKHLPGFEEDYVFWWLLGGCSELFSVYYRLWLAWRIWASGDCLMGRTVNLFGSVDVFNMCSYLSFINFIFELDLVRVVVPLRPQIYGCAGSLWSL